MSSLLHIKNIAVGYGKNAILKDISLDIHRGEIIGLIGRNGTGKTTLLRTLAGLQKPVSGNVFIDSQSLYSLTPKERAKRVSIVLTQRIALQGINVHSLLEMGRFPSLNAFPFLQRKNEEQVNALVDACLEKLNIQHLAEKSLAQLSDGELQKAMIARSLVQQTPLILMDEPTAFLDYVAKEELFIQLKKLAKEENIAILFSSHDLELVNKYADRIFKVEEGLIKVKQ